MKNRVLGLAIVGAMLGMGGPHVLLFSGGLPSVSVGGPGAPQSGLRGGGSGPGYSMAGLFSGGGLRHGGYRPGYKKRGWSVAEDRRRARKRRNKLRAKGHHRAAVR